MEEFEGSREAQRPLKTHQTLVTTLCVTVTNTDQCVPGSLEQQRGLGSRGKFHKGATTAATPSALLQLNRISPSAFACCLDQVAAQIFKSTILIKQALPYKGHDRPSSPPGLAVIALNTYPLQNQNHQLS